MTSFNDIFALSRSAAAGRVNEYGVFEMVAANSPRLDFDPVNLSLRGLLIEESRANLIANSSALDAWEVGGTPTVAANSAIGPDGALSADTVTLPNTSAIIRSSTFSVAAGALHAFTVYAKPGSGNFNMQFRNVGGTQIAIASVNTTTGVMTAGAITSATISSMYRTPGPLGFDRYVLVASLVNAETNNARVGLSGVTGGGSPILWGVMVEPGPFETSYFPTTTTAATRPADVVVHGSLSPWFNSSEGTMLVEAYPAGQIATAAPYAWEIRNSSMGNSRMALFQQAAGPLSGVVLAVGVSSASFTVNAAGNPRKWGMAYHQDDFAFCVNSGAVVTDTSGSLPAGLNAGSVGSSSSLGGRHWNGHIRRLRFFPRRLTNEKLQAITA